MASDVHWSLCGVCGFACSDQWWCHQPESVLDNFSYKLPYDFNIFTDHGIADKWPDLVLVDKVARSTKIIDIACVMDHHVVDKHGEKIEKYLDLAIELQLLWNTKVEIVPLVFGALGSLHEKTYFEF